MIEVRAVAHSLASDAGTRYDTRLGVPKLCNLDSEVKGTIRLCQQVTPVLSLMKCSSYIIGSRIRGQNNATRSRKCGYRDVYVDILDLRDKGERSCSCGSCSFFVERLDRRSHRVKVGAQLSASLRP